MGKVFLHFGVKADVCALRSNAMYLCVISYSQKGLTLTCTCYSGDHLSTSYSVTSTVRSKHRRSATLYFSMVADTEKVEPNHMNLKAAVIHSTLH